MTAASWTLSGQSLPVTYERLLKADQEPGNWLMYSGTYSGWRYSRLNQITAQNVKNLRVKWLFQGRHLEKFETTPLVVDGIMYLTRPENAIYALDAVTGRQLWMYEYRNPERTFNCCGKSNRGLAMLGKTLFMNTLDMHVIAVDAKSGREIWKTKMFDHTAAGRLRRARSAARREGQGDRRHGRRRARRQRVPRCVRSEDRRAGSGASTRFRSRANRTSARGPAIPGRPAARQPGTPAPTIPTRTRCSGARATRGRTTTTTCAPATTCTPARCWRWIRTPAS